MSDDLSFLMRHRLIAILRGLTPQRALAVGDALFDAGVRVMEVPLNSPDAIVSIALLSARFGGNALIGAGTVLSVDDVEAVAAAGGKLSVSPNTDVEVIAAGKRAGLVCAPGVFTPTDAFRAMHAGADVLKLFPAEIAGPHGLRALRVVLPASMPLFVVGGVAAANLAQWRAAGADGIGVGSAMFQPEMSDDRIGEAAREFVGPWGSLIDSAIRGAA